MFATNASDRDLCAPYGATSLKGTECPDWMDDGVDLDLEEREDAGLDLRVLDLLRAAKPEGGWTMEEIHQAESQVAREDYLGQSEPDDGRFGPEPVLFVDGNYPGVCYRGTLRHMAGLVYLGGCPWQVKASPVNTLVCEGPVGLPWPVQNAPDHWADFARQAG